LTWKVTAKDPIGDVATDEFEMKVKTRYDTTFFVMIGIGFLLAVVLPVMLLIAYKFLLWRSLEHYDKYIKV